MSWATSKHTCKLIILLLRRACKLNACDPQLNQAALSETKFMPGSMRRFFPNIQQLKY